MIIVLKPGASDAGIDVSRRVGEMGFKTHLSAMAKAGLAAGADGLIIVHNNPAEALSDGPQSLRPDRFAALMAELRPSGQILGRSL